MSGEESASPSFLRFRKSSFFLFSRANTYRIRFAEGERFQARVPSDREPSQARRSACFGGGLSLGAAFCGVGSVWCPIGSGQALPRPRQRSVALFEGPVFFFLFWRGDPVCPTLRVWCARVPLPMRFERLLYHFFFSAVSWPLNSSLLSPLRPPFSTCPLVELPLKFPVHCAAAGGSVSALAWLMEDRCCPIFLDHEKTVRAGSRVR